MSAHHLILTPELQSFITSQPLFFVASAPLSAKGHVNISPKGLDTFRILSPQSVAYLDLTGSGNETAAHILENSRITFMFCSFQDPPKILRLYGTARTLHPNAPEWPSLLSLFPTFPGIRQIHIATITRIQTSCGFGVPLMQPLAQRNTLHAWTEKKGPAAVLEYQQKKNLTSIDGLPTGLTPS